MILKTEHNWRTIHISKEDLEALKKWLDSKPAIAETFEANGYRYKRIKTEYTATKIVQKGTPTSTLDWWDLGEVMESIKNAQNQP